MTRIPIQTDVLALAFREDPIPNRGLPKHIEMHDREVIGALWTMLETNPHPHVGREARQRFPKSEELRHIILERLVNRIATPFEQFRFNDRARETRNRFDPDLRGHFDGPPKNIPRKSGLPGIERVLVERADGGDAQTARLG